MSLKELALSFGVAVVSGAFVLGFALMGGIVKGGSEGSPLGAFAGPDVYSYLNVFGAFTEGGDVVTVTPTSATVTFTASQLEKAKVLTFVASTTMPALTATLPASTTMPLKVGQSRTWVIENPFTAAATTTTIAAGTGIDLQEPDGQNVVIGINNYAWVECFRELSTDVVCKINETIPAD